MLQDLNEEVFNPEPGPDDQNDILPDLNVVNMQVNDEPEQPLFDVDNDEIQQQQTAAPVQLDFPPFGFHALIPLGVEEVPHDQLLGGSSFSSNSNAGPHQVIFKFLMLIPVIQSLRASLPFGTLASFKFQLPSRSHLTLGQILWSLDCL